MEVTERFSDRVYDYILYRPGYPIEVIEFLKKQCGLTPTSIIADIGSGTGKSSDMFLENGNTVFAVEPNDEMRHAAERLLSGFSNFKSINATAENTSLPDASIDFIIVGQAFHWFKKEETKTEFKKILRPGGYIALIWNERPVNQSGFMGAYEDFLIQNSTDYTEIDHRKVDDNVLSAFFAPDTYALAEFEYNQVFDFEGLKGRYDSCSYAIPKNDSNYEDVLSKLYQLFDKYENNGKVIMKYETKLYWGN